jgi:hypothetical protein
MVIEDDARKAESTENQKILPEDSFENWRGSNDQIDDVCVFVVRVTEKMAPSLLYSSKTVLCKSP